MNGKLVFLWKNSTCLPRSAQPIGSVVSLRLPPYISVSNAREPISAVNMDVTMPSVSTMAKPLDRAGAEHPQHDAGDERW